MHIKQVKTQVIHYRLFQNSSYVVVLCCPFLVLSFGDVSPYVCPCYFSSVCVAE